MKKLILLFAVFLITTYFPNPLLAQSTVSDSSFKPSGKLWGYAFGDFYYKAHGDPLNRGGNQYSGIEGGRNAFQIRRVYLGYNYDITPKFSAEMLISAEENVVTSTGVTSGDLLTNNKLSFFLKLANLRWKNIWKGTDLVVGQAATLAFSPLVEPTWGYRSIEKTITDMHRTPSYDLGAALQGKFDPDKGKYGYNLMVSNGTGARPENDKFKWFSGDVYAKLLDKKLLFDFYADYQRFNWVPGFHHSRNMFKGFVAYSTDPVTIGVEAFVEKGKSDVVGVKGAARDTLNATAEGLSVFAHGNVIKDKLGFFARSDFYNPDDSYSNVYSLYQGLNTPYEPNNKELFLTAGLDFTPAKNIHFMPNVWYCRYTGQHANLTGPDKQDHDLVYRLTFFYVYGR